MDKKIILLLMLVSLFLSFWLYNMNTKLSNHNEVVEESKEEVTTSISEYKYRGKRLTLGENLDFLIEKLDGLVIESGETIYVNEFIGEHDLDSYSDVARAYFTIALMECIGKNTDTFKEYHLGELGTYLLMYEDNYVFTNFSKFEYIVKYVGSSDYPKQYYFDVYINN